MACAVLGGGSEEGRKSSADQFFRLGSSCFIPTANPSGTCARSRLRFAWSISQHQVNVERPDEVMCREAVEVVDLNLHQGRRTLFLFGVM